MGRKSRYAILATGFVGLVVAAVGPDLTSTRALAAGLGAGGWAVMWAGILGADRVSRATGRTDERFARIYHRSGYYGWIVALAASTLLLFTHEHLSWELTLNHALLAVAVPSLATFAVLADAYRRRM